jgi:3-hydroxyisobutyrate dehydrogenase
MASGPEDRVRAARPYFDAVGSNVFYYGSRPGSSQAAKLVNNLILGITHECRRRGAQVRRAVRPPRGGAAEPVPDQHR